MRRRHGIWVVGLLAAVLGVTAVGVHASSAAPTRATARIRTLDKTFSCRVRRQHYVDLYASVTLPPIGGQPQAGVLVLTTGVKTIRQNNAVETVSQIGIQAKKNSLRIDESSCVRVKQQIPLTRKGISGPPTTATPTLGGHDNEQCGTTARVLVRLHLTTTNRTPSHALLAIRDDDVTRQPIAFYNWSPRRFSVYTGNTCVGSS